MKAKKILAMLMASAMIMGTTVTAFAADPVDVIIHIPQSLTTDDHSGDPENDAVVRYEPVIIPDTSSPIGWKFASEDIEDAFEAVFPQIDSTTTLDQVIALYNETEPNSNAENGVIHSSVELASVAESITPTKADAIKVRETNTVETWTFEADTAGLYLITVQKEGYTYIPMLAYVKDTGSGELATDVEVTAKGSEDQIRKTIEETGQSVAEGDLVTYTVTAEYPYYDNAYNPKYLDSLKFTVTDTLQNATFETNTMDLVVRVDGEELTNGTDYYMAIDPEHTNVMTIDLGGQYYKQKYAGKEVTIAYKARVGKVSADEGGELKNDVTSSIETGETDSEVISNVLNFTVTKIDENLDTEGEKIYLEGAGFTLYVADADGDTELSYGEGNVRVSQVGTEQFTNTKGVVTFDGLDAQETYYVKETTAPEGYSLNNTVYILERNTEGDDVSQTVAEDGTIITEYIFGDYTDQEVVDTKLADLPSTGGIGTTIFTIGGCVIMVTAAGLYFATRKKEQK